jgi:hypothetical protein
MKPLRLAASVAALLGGILGTYSGFVFAASGGIQSLVEALGVILVVDSLVCLYGARLAFAGSAAISASFALAAWVGWGGGNNALQLGTLGVAALSCVLSIAAYRSTSAIPEQANPMNLPVFG